MCDFRQAFHLHIAGQRHATGMNLEDFQAPVLVRNGDGDFAVKPPGPAQGRIERVGDIGGANDNHISARLKAIQQSEQLGNHTAFNLFLAAHVFPLRGNGVNFVNKNNGRRVFLGVFEHRAQAAFAFAIEFAHDLRAGDMREIGVRFVGHGAGNQGLPGAGRPVQEHAFRRLNA